jgi:hypothetical protein
VSRLRVILCLPYIPRIGRGCSKVVTTLLIFWNPQRSVIVQVEVRLRSVGRSLLTDQGLAGARIRFLSNRPLTSSVELSIEILSLRLPLILVCPWTNYMKSVHTCSLGFNTLEILWGESYNDICALADLFFVSLKYPTSFLALLLGNSCCIYLPTQWSSYLFTFLYSTFTPVTHGEAILLRPLRLNLWVQWSINFLIRPWTSFYIMDMVQDRPFFGVINADHYFHLEEFEELCSCLGSPRHDTWIHKVEVVPPLFVRKGGAMVHWHYK